MTARLPVVGSPRERAIIRETNESGFALNFLETVVLLVLGHVKKLVTPYCPQTWQHQHFVVSPSVTESGESALRRLLAGRAIGGNSLTSDDLAV